MSLTSETAGTTANGIVLFNFTGVRTTAGIGFRIDDSSSTLATAMAINANSLTTGKALNISATSVTSAGANTGSLLNITGPDSGSTLIGIGVEFKSFIGAGGTLQEIKPTFSGASGTAAGLKLTLTDSTTGTSGFNIIDIPAFTSANTTANKNAINIGTLTPSANSTETAINIGSGWDREIFFTSTAPIIEIANDASPRNLTIRNPGAG